MTRGGLKKADLKEDAKGKIISKAASDASKNKLNRNNLKMWRQASDQACEELNVDCDVIGAVKKRTKVYNRAKELYEQMRQ